MCNGNGDSAGSNLDRIFSGEDEEPFAEDWLDYVSSEALVIELTPFVIVTE